MAQRYHIATATDAHYFVPAYTMLFSLFETNKDICFDVYILYNGLSDTQKDAIHTLAGQYGHSVYFLAMDDALFSAYPSLNYQTVATYYRLYIPLMVKDKVDTILYIDADIVINGSILPLLQTQLGAAPLMAVKEAIPVFVERLGLPETFDCFNAGVLLLNVRRWNEYSYTEILTNKLLQNKNLKNDQEVLNVVFYENIEYLHPKWNFQSWHYKLDDDTMRARYGISSGDLFEETIVIHFTGPSKPWKYLCTHPYKILFRQYINKSPYQNFNEPGNLRLVIKKMRLRITHKFQKIFRLRATPSY